MPDNHLTVNLFKIGEYTYFKFLRSDGRPRRFGGQMLIPCVCQVPFTIYPSDEAREIRADAPFVYLIGFGQDKAMLQYTGAHPCVPIEAVEVISWNGVDPAARAAFKQAQAEARQRRYIRQPEYDCRIGRGDDFAGDAWWDKREQKTIWVVVGHNPTEQLCSP